MAVGGRRMFSVASNRGSRRDVGGWWELAEQNDFAAARRIHTHFCRFSDQLRRIEPDSREERDGRDGALDETYRLPMVPPRDESRTRIRHVFERSGAARRIGEHDGVAGAGEVALVDAGAQVDRAAAREAFVKLREQLTAGEVRAAEPDACGAHWVARQHLGQQGVLLGFRHGETMTCPRTTDAGHSSDEDTLPLQRPEPEARESRIVPGGSMMRKRVIGAGS